MQILDMAKEGFQANTTPTMDQIYGTTCKSHNIAGQNYWLCATDNDAQTQVRYLISTGDVFAGACYKTPYQGFYTCYTRPSQKSYNSDEGVFVIDDPSEDGMPSGIEYDIMNVCADYGTTLNTFSTLYVSTASIGSIVQSTINTVEMATADLGAISTGYCIFGVARDAAAQRTCNTLSTGISIFNGIPRARNGLYFMSTTINNSISNMDNLYSNQFVNAYKGFGYSTCNFPTFFPV